MIYIDPTKLKSKEYDYDTLIEIIKDLQIENMGLNKENNFYFDKAYEWFDGINYACELLEKYATKKENVIDEWGAFESLEHIKTAKEWYNYIMKGEIKKMTYYNPRTYNYSNLKEEDKQIVVCMYDMVKDLEDTDAFDIDGETSIVEKMRREIEKGALNTIVSWMHNYIIEFIVYTIDSYQEEVEEIETNSYFYELKG